MASPESICVVSSGVVHAVSRTIVLAAHFQTIHFIDLKGNLEQNDFQGLENIKLYSLPRWGCSVLAYWDLIELFLLLQPEVIICHYVSGYHFFLALVFGKCPVVGICMGTDILYDQGDMYVPIGKRFLIREGLRRTSYLSAKSEYLKEKIISFNVKRPIDTIYWGSDLHFFHSRDKGSMRKALCIEPGAKVVLSPRAVAPVYHIELIVKAFSRFVNEEPDAILLILGRMGYGEYVASLKNIVHELGIEHQVRWVGEVKQTELPAYYCAADVVVSMAKAEGFPNTILEVMGCETPIVCGKIPQISELLTHKNNAWLCDFTEESVYDGVSTLLLEKNFGKQIAAEALQTVRRFGDINHNGKLFSQRVREVAANTKKGPSLLWRLFYGCAVFGYIIVDKLKRIGQRVIGGKYV